MPSRRLAVFLACVWYFLCASQGAAIALDAFVSASKTVAADADFACAAHECACDTAEKAAANCCCFPDGVEAPAWESVTEDMEARNVRVSFLAAEACWGASPFVAGTQGFAPHLFSFGMTVPPPALSEVLSGGVSAVPPAVFPESPDKIPIAVS